MNAFKFPFFITTIGEIFSDKPNSYTTTNFIFDKEKDKEINNLFQSLKSMTSKEDMLSQLRLKLITDMAEHLKCNKIFTAEVGTDLAIKFLSNMSLGRGNQLPLQVVRKSISRNNLIQFDLRFFFFFLGFL